MKIISALFMLLLPVTAQARFYTFENLPAKPLNFDRAYAAALRLEVVNGGGDHCSAVSVSPDGYVLTNLHCVKQCLVDNGFAKNGFEEIKSDYYTILRTKIQNPKGLSCEDLSWDDADGNAHWNGKIVWLGRGTNTYLDPYVDKIPADVFSDINAHDDDFALMKFDLQKPVACVPAAAEAAKAGDTVWNIGYPNYTMRYDGFDSTGYKKHISFGAVTGDVRADAYLATVLTTETQWKLEETAYDLNRILLSITDSMNGSSGSMDINSSGGLLAIHYSATSPSELRMRKYLGANALGLRVDGIIQELKAGLGEAAAAKIFSCPPGTGAEKAFFSPMISPKSLVLERIGDMRVGTLFDGSMK